MATIAPEKSADTIVHVYTWYGISTGDTINAIEPEFTWPLAGSVQMTGTFGGATVTLAGSNDGTNYVTLSDTVGSALSFSAAGGGEFSTAMLYIKPTISGGTSDSVDVTVVLRG